MVPSWSCTRLGMRTLRKDLRQQILLKLTENFYSSGICMRGRFSRLTRVPRSSLAHGVLSQINLRLAKGERSNSWWKLSLSGLSACLYTKRVLNVKSIMFLIVLSPVLWSQLTIPFSLSTPILAKSCSRDKFEISRSS